MKLKFVLLALVGTAGVTASYALADSGGHKGREHANAANNRCSRAIVFGTAAAPQSFTVTVTHAGRHSQFKNGDVVTVSMGTQGQSVAITGFGCADGSTLTASLAQLRVRQAPVPPTTTAAAAATTTTGEKHGDGHRGTTTTTTTTTAGTTSSGTTTEQAPPGL